MSAAPNGYIQVAKKQSSATPDPGQDSPGTPTPSSDTSPASKSKSRRNRSPKLSWYPARNCWRYRVKIRGKEHVFYVGKGAEGPNDEVAKADAILEAVSCRDRAESDSRMLLHAKSVGGGLKAIAQQVEDLHAFFQQPFQVVIDKIFIDEDVPQLLRDAAEGEVRKLEVQILKDRIEELEAMLAAHGRAAVTDANASLEDLKTKWIEAIKNEKKSAKQSASHIGSFKCNIEPFIEFLADNDPPILLTRDLEANWRAVADYREHVIEEMNERELSKGWGKGRLDKARLFCEYLVKNAYLGVLPRAIDRHWSRIGKDDPNPTFFSLEEIHRLWKEANPRMKLVMALGLNAGYRAADIRTLERDAVDFGRGEIRRQRSKTKAAQAHKLWPATKALLEDHAKNTPDDLLFGKGYSNISRELTAFVDKVLTKEKNEDPRRTAKSFRSTGAQELERIVLGTAPHVVDQYLAHGDKKLARHYREQELTALFEALDKLGQYFNLDETRPEPKKRSSKRHARDA